MKKAIELLVIIVALNLGQLNAQNKVTSDTTKNSSSSTIEEDEFGFNDIDAEIEASQQRLAETKKRLAEQKKRLAEQKKRLAEQGIIAVDQYKQILLLSGKITIAERKSIINHIATVKVYENLLKNKADYNETMKKHNKNVEFLKKELNITEQEIGNEIKKLKNSSDE